MLTAYGATGYAPVRKDPTIVAIAQGHDVTPVQVCLAWALARGKTAIVKSIKPDHQRMNLLVRACFSEKFFAFCSYMC